ncbi:family 20 glycosylhydrolase [Kribbella catacumbae]|uniref:family 20 glycosylhydrolase n=1 Tax=Kribbella catacumbae TaxID=460086 RepID=UPI00037A0372|nr:family 20 glycosylhydrolase [Kribbella catacumbae]
MTSHVPPRTVLLALLALIATCLVGVPLASAGTAAVSDGAAISSASQSAAGSGRPLIPLPVVAEDVAGDPFTLRPSLVVVAPGSAAPLGAQLAAHLRKSTGFKVPLVSRGGSQAIRITVDPAAAYTVDGRAPTAESYVLDVTGAGVTITARTAHGAFNGVQTLRQLLPAWAESATPVRTGWQVRPIHIEDAPRFSYRGVMLDVARSFQEVDEVKHYIDVLSAMKMNVLHLHLADDQGWRIEITNNGKAAGDPIDYSALTRESGITAMNQQGYRQELGRTGYYTQAQYRDIVAYAQKRHVTVVPEVDIPGHTNAALHAIPQLNTDRSLPARNPQTGVVDWNGTGNVGYSALDEKHELSYTFVAHVFKQLAAMTGGPYVHLGGDESHAMGHTRYVEFVRRAVPVLQRATGVGTMGWTEYAEAGLAQGPGYWNGSVVQYWVGSGDWVRDFVSKGGKAVVSAAGGSYLDQKYNSATPIGLTWACSGTCDFQKYYSWDPTTTISGGVPESGILGVEGPLWSETVRGGDQAGFLTMPRAAAILETGWTPAAKKDVTGFAARLGLLGPHLTVAGSNYYESAGATWAASVAGTDVAARPGSTGPHRVGLVVAPGTKASADGTQIVPDTVSTDGDPASKSALTGPLTATLTCGTAALPVRFGQQQARDNLHGAGTYTATVQAAFSTDTDCMLTPSTGEAVPIRVRATDRAPVASDAPAGTPALSVGRSGKQVHAGTWVPLDLTGFAPGYVDIRIDGRTVYTVRPGANGEFHRTGVVPHTLYDGKRTFSAVQGERSASVVVDVESDLKPLPNLIDQTTLKVHDVDSAETVGENGAAGNAIDGNPNSIWHTQWLNGAPGFPHHITLDLGKAHDVTGLQYLQRQNARNGRIKDYRIAVSADGTAWTDVATGSFAEVLTPQNVTFGAVRGRYVRLTGLNTHPGNAFGGAAEINIGGVPAP